MYEKKDTFRTIFHACEIVGSFELLWINDGFSTLRTRDLIIIYLFTMNGVSLNTTSTNLLQYYKSLLLYFIILFYFYQFWHVHQNSILVHLTLYILVTNINIMKWIINICLNHFRPFQCCRSARELGVGDGWIRY